MKRIISVLLSVLLAIGAFASVTATVNAEESNSYKEDFINALLENEDEWYENWGTPIVYPSAMTFTDLNFDGKLEFIMQYGGGWMANCEADAYYFENDNIHLLDSNKLTANSKGFENILTGYYDTIEKEYILLGESRCRVSGTEEWLGDFTLYFNGSKLTTDYYSSKWHKYDFNTDKTSIKYYNGANGYANSTGINIISETEYNKINNDKLENLIDINMKREFIYCSDWENYSYEQKKQALGKSYDGFIYDEVKHVGYDFNEYKANRIIDYHWNYGNSLNKDGSYYRTIVEKSREDNSIFNMQNLTKTYLALSNLDSLKDLNEQVRQEYYYKMVLSDLLLQQKSSKDFNEVLYNDAMNFANKIQGYCESNIKEIVKDGLKTNLKNNPTLKNKIKNSLTNLDILENELDVLDILLDGCNVLGDFIDRISNYLSVKKMSVETIAILSSAAKNTNNADLRNAFNEYSKIYKSNLDQIIDYSKEKAASEMFFLLTQKVSDTVLSKLPGSIIANCIYSGGKLISEALTSSKTTSILYLQMCATYEIEDAINAAATKAKSQYESDKTVSNAQLFNTGFEMMLDVANYGNNLLIDYCANLDSGLLAKLQQELKLNNGMSDEINKFKKHGREDIVDLQQKVNLIYNNYIAEFPELFNAALENILTNGKFSIVSFCDRQYDITAISNDDSVPSTSKLNIRDLNDTERKNVENVFDKNNLIKTYDITLTDNGTEIQVNDNGYIIIKIPMPKGVDPNKIFVYRVEKDGTKVRCQSYEEDGKLVFVTNHFSIYAVVSENGSETDYTPGDINNDGKINMKDIVLLQQFLNGWNVSINKQAANVNADSSINMKDIVLLQQYLNGWKVVLK